MPLDKLPPHDIETELSCLSSALLNREALLKVIEILQPDDFYLEKHRLIFESIVELDKKNLPVDLITIKQRLSDKNLFERVGGDAGLVDIYQTTSSSINAQYYAQRIKELSLRRRLISVSQVINERCYDMSIETKEFIDSVEHDIFDLTARRITSDFRNISDVLQETIHDIGMMYETKRTVTGTGSGYTEIDETLTGLHGSELIIVAARPSMGKTALALNIANHVVLHENKPVLFFSLEMPATQLGMRLLCVEAMIDSQRVRTGHISSDDMKKLIQTSGRLGKSPLLIDDSPALDILQLRAKARRRALKEPLGLIIVDYLQLVTPSIKGDRHLQIADISRSLKQLARELHVPVIAISQLSRAVETRTDQRPMLSDLRESGAIEQDADVVIFIYREEKVKKDTEKKGIAEIIIAKQRNGPTRTVELKFWEKYTKFDNLDTIHMMEEAV